jgi:hypothetical protein
MDRDEFFDHSARILLDLNFEEPNPIAEETGTDDAEDIPF